MSNESAVFKQTATAYLPFASFTPASKLAAGFSFAVCVSLLTHHTLALIACIIPLFLAIAGRLPILMLLKKLVPMNLFFIFLWLFLPLDLSSGTLTFSRAGVELAALITLKGNAIAAMLLALLGTSTVSETCRGLLKLHLPEKLVTLLLLTYSNITHMKQEYVKISAAAKLRGFVSVRSLASYKTTAYLAGMLLVRSWQRAQRINKAMHLRGFSGQYPLLDLPPATPYNKYGWVFCRSMCLISISLLLINIFI